MKRYNFLIFLLIPFLAACLDDKGNYEYQDLGDIVIENVPEVIEVLSNGDPIVISPKVTSTTEGEIKDGNPNYQFIYRFDLKTGTLNDKGGPWIVLNPGGSMNLDTLAAFASNDYIGCFTVKDLRNGLETYKTFDVKVTSPTYEGWMVLCNEGEENRVRFDMVSRISAERIVPVHDILGDLGLPECHNATQIGFSPGRVGVAGSDVIYVLSETGSYLINKETFKTDESWDMRNIDFMLPPTDQPVRWGALNNGFLFDNIVRICVTSGGNVYAKTASSAGASFELPVNTSVRGGKPEYKVAPFVGFSQLRPGNAESALLYDVDHKRFVGWAEVENADGRQVLTPLQDPANKLFSFQTGKDLVYMEGTRFSGGVVYAVLQGTDGERSVYAVNMGGQDFRQESAYNTIQASEFKQATKFAFHSQYPFMFYAVKNKVYLYDFGTSVNYPLPDINLNDTEEVTMLKFNLYQNPDLTTLSDQSDEFIARQYDLIVGSYDAMAGKSGGKLGFYRINRTTHSVSKLEEYDGFAKIVDVVYRERRK